MSGVGCAYDARAAGMQARRQRFKARRCSTLAVDSVLFGVVRHFLSERWSPCQIASTLKRMWPDEPQLITKHQTRWTGFDDKIISLYARGMTMREIQSHFEDMYGNELSPSLISSVTDAVADEVKAWQARPLDAIYPIV